MRSLTVLVPGPLAARSGGSIYDRHIVDGLRARGWSIDVRELDASFPVPTATALRNAAGILASCRDGERVLADGLAFGAMPCEVADEARRLRFIALVHLPLAAAIGLDRASAQRLEASERRALACAAAVVATGKATVAALERVYGVALDRVTLIEPGTDCAGLARGSRDARLALLCAAAVTAGKGHDVLVQALAPLRGLDWQLTCAGSLERDPSTVGGVRALVRDLGLDDRVFFTGELDAAALAAQLDAADLFVLAPRHETYCMAVAEALAHGLPVVATETGAIPDLVAGGDRPAGLLAQPGDVRALSEALRRVISDPELRSQLACGARSARERLGRWDTAVERFEHVLSRIDEPTPR